MRAMLRKITLVVWIGVAPVALSEDPASLIEASFSDQGQATLQRLEQDPVQQHCSQPRDQTANDEVAMTLRHQLAPTEVAYGTLGPSLTQYGMRGQSDVMLRYTWTKLWDTHAFNLCSHMPRFGAQKILTEQQLKDVMAFLLDPNSSVNQPTEGPSSSY